VVSSSACPHGQGHETTFAQIAADRLGSGLDQIVMRFGDSATVPRGVGTFGSRSVAMAGSAIVIAIEKLVALARPLAAHLLACEPGSVQLTEGTFTSPQTGDAVSWSDLAHAAYQPERLPSGMEIGLRAAARFRSPLVFSSGAHSAVVEIERATGKLRVLRVAAVDDAGTVINPLLVHGQVIGGVVQALGECLVEEVIHDDNGQNRSGSFMDYSLLTAAEIPPITTGEVASPSPLNPLGAKGAGEGGTVGTLPAVANAVADALGGLHLDPPYGAEKLWRALRETAP
jgi:carbon-monoxide dehydrogenase large subunit